VLCSAVSTLACWCATLPFVPADLPALADAVMLLLCVTLLGMIPAARDRDGPRDGRDRDGPRDSRREREHGDGWITRGRERDDGRERDGERRKGDWGDSFGSKRRDGTASRVAGLSFNFSRASALGVSILVFFSCADSCHVPSSCSRAVLVPSWRPFTLLTVCLPVDVPGSQAIASVVRVPLVTALRAARRRPLHPQTRPPVPPQSARRCDSLCVRRAGGGGFVATVVVVTAIVSEAGGGPCGLVRCVLALLPLHLLLLLLLPLLLLLLLPLPLLLLRSCVLLFYGLIAGSEATHRHGRRRQDVVSPPELHLWRR
jgi:hypothetical protein